jgi:hypothetical protein
MLMSQSFANVWDSQAKKLAVWQRRLGGCGAGRPVGGGVHGMMDREEGATNTICYHDHKVSSEHPAVVKYCRQYFAAGSREDSKSFTRSTLDGNSMMANMMIMTLCR